MLRNRNREAMAPPRYVLLIFGIGSNISITLSEYRVLCLRAGKQAGREHAGRRGGFLATETGTDRQPIGGAASRESVFFERRKPTIRVVFVGIPGPGCL